jgi:hypothetical protein
MNENKITECSVLHILQFLTSKLSVKLCVDFSMLKYSEKLTCLLNAKVDQK